MRAVKIGNKRRWFVLFAFGHFFFLHFFRCDLRSPHDVKVNVEKDMRPLLVLGSSQDRDQ